MANRPSRLEISIPTASSDGRYWGRYPAGNAPASGPLKITTLSRLPNATRGVAYTSPAVAVMGGTAPYTFALPTQTGINGYTINAATGVISGTPCSAEVNDLWVCVTDAALAKVWVLFYVKAVFTRSAFDYYVSPTGNDANPGTLAQPWSPKSLGVCNTGTFAAPVYYIHANQKLIAGKRVGLLPGRYIPLAPMSDFYHASWLVSGQGTVGAPTTFAASDLTGLELADPSTQSTLFSQSSDGTWASLTANFIAKADGDTLGWAFFWVGGFGGLHGSFVGAGNVVFRALATDKTASAFLLLQADYVTVASCWFRDMDSSYMQTSAPFDGVGHIDNGTPGTAGHILTIVSVANGTLKVGDFVYIANSNSVYFTVLALGTGTGGVGTYTVDGGPQLGTNGQVTVGYYREDNDAQIGHPSGGYAGFVVNRNTTIYDSKFDGIYNGGNGAHGVITLHGTPALIYAHQNVALIENEITNVYSMYFPKGSGGTHFLERNFGHSCVCPVFEQIGEACAVNCNPVLPNQPRHRYSNNIFYDFTALSRGTGDVPGQTDIDMVNNTTHINKFASGWDMYKFQLVTTSSGVGSGGGPFGPCSSWYLNNVHVMMTAPASGYRIWNCSNYPPANLSIIDIAALIDFNMWTPLNGGVFITLDAGHAPINAVNFADWKAQALALGKAFDANSEQATPLLKNASGNFSLATDFKLKSIAGGDGVDSPGLTSGQNGDQKGAWGGCASLNISPPLSIGKSW